MGEGHPRVYEEGDSKIEGDNSKGMQYFQKQFWPLLPYWPMGGPKLTISVNISC